MIKLLFISYRKEGLTHEECLREGGGEQHVTVVSKIPGLLRWKENHVNLMPHENAADVVAELWFESAESMQAAMETPEWHAAVEDAKRFLDMEKTYAMTVEEKVFIE